MTIQLTRLIRDKWHFSSAERHLLNSHWKKRAKFKPRMIKVIFQLNYEFLTIWAAINLLNKKIYS